MRQKHLFAKPELYIAHMLGTASCVLVGGWPLADCNDGTEALMKDASPSVLPWKIISLSGRGWQGGFGRLWTIAHLHGYGEYVRTCMHIEIAGQSSDVVLILSDCRSS